MGIEGFVVNCRRDSMDYCELEDWNLFNPVVYVAEMDNVYYHIVKFIDLPRRTGPRNKLASFIAGPGHPFNGDVFVYALTDRNELLSYQDLFYNLCVLNDRMSRLQLR